MKRIVGGGVFVFLFGVGVKFCVLLSLCGQDLFNEMDVCRHACRSRPCTYSALGDLQIFMVCILCRLCGDFFMAKPYISIFCLCPPYRNMTSPYGPKKPSFGRPPLIRVGSARVLYFPTLPERSQRGLEGVRVGSRQNRNSHMMIGSC